MQRCSYRVLEFAKSERESHGLAIAVILRFNDLQEQFLKSFYLDGWQDMIGTGFEWQVSHVEDVLHDFRQYAHRSFSDSEDVMGHAANLSVGPLRTGLVGEGALPPLGQIHPSLADDLESQVCSETAFSALVRAMIANADPALEGSRLDPNYWPYEESD